MLILPGKTASWSGGGGGGWSDDFEGRTEAIGDGADYTLIGGTVNVTSGVARHTAKSQVQIDAAAAQVADGTWTIVHDNSATIGHEFRFRYVDESNWIRVSFTNSGFITIDTLVAGSFTRHEDVDRSADLSGGASETSIIEFSGSSITARWIGGTNVTSTRTEFQTETGKSWQIDGVSGSVDILEMSIT